MGGNNYWLRGKEPQRDHPTLAEFRAGHTLRIAAEEKRAVELLLQGCENPDIARDLGIAERTVKKHFAGLFKRYGVTSGIKRVKLAVLLYREQLRDEVPQNQNAHNA